MREEIHQLKTEKTKDKGSQHDPEHAADKEKTPAGGVPQHVEQHFITMAEVAALLEQERAKVPKERFYARRPPYPLKELSKPYPKRYEPRAFAQYEGRKGSVIEHVSKFIDTFGPYFFIFTIILCFHIALPSSAAVLPLPFGIRAIRSFLASDSVVVSLCLVRVCPKL
ncbi:hypothetical protein SO802_029545 [Lithocarpus litseifolius]|uniref:Uncharacterized protein n=1 Tax=Lithocarpus litseifolius TaxID=425828 RepID=A0AAW2BVF6_9ROSI